MIKIAIPTRDEQVDDHFGHCDTTRYLLLMTKNK